MNAAQRYIYESQGWLHVPGVLSPDEAAHLCTLARGLAAPGSASDGEFWQGGLSLLRAGPEFRALLDHPMVSPLLEDICGDRTGTADSRVLPTFRAVSLFSSHPDWCLSCGLGSGPLTWPAGLCAAP